MINLNINERLKFVKDNIQYIILLPTIFGGIWQLLELANISISFIRFFSVSQLVADGLLILFIVAFLYMGYKIVSFQSKKDEEDFSKYSNRENVFLGILIILLSISMFWWLCVPFLKLLLVERKTDLPSLVLCFSITIILSRFLLEGLKRILLPNASLFKQRLIKLSSDKNSELMISLFAQIIYIVLILCFFLFVYLLITLRNNYSFPKELENLNNIKCVFDKRDIGETSWDILYFNDKYIFTKYYDQGESKFLIIEFEKLLENECE